MTKRLMKWFYFSALIFTVQIFVAPSYATSVEKIAIVTEHFPPYQFKDKADHISGYATEIISAALAHTNYRYNISIYPWTRAYNMARKKTNTCIYSMARMPYRESLFQWTQPIISATDYFVGLKSNTKIKLSSIDDAKRFRVAVIRDDRSHKVLLDHGFVENKNLYVVNNTFSLLKLLLSRPEIDLVLADNININYRAKFNHLDPNLFKIYLKVSPKPIDLYFACSNATPADVVEKINNAISTIKQNGEYEKISQPWLNAMVKMK